MTIYLDIVLIENLLMNYIILFTTGFFIKAKTSIPRLLISSIVGGIYAVIGFMDILQIYSNLFLKILLSIAMIYVAFKPLKIKLLCKQVILFYLVSFAFGGTAFALLYFVKPQDILMKNGLFIGTYPLKIAFLGAIVGFLVLQVGFRTIKTKMRKKDMFCEIEIQIQNEKELVTAMIDTGNLLKEPITGLSVMVVEGEKLKNIIPEVIENIEEIMIGNTESIKEEEKLKLRVIPFSSLGKQNGLLLGIKPDEITIKLEEGDMIRKDVMIGIYPKDLTKNGLYHALIGLELLERSTNEYITNVKV